MKFHIGQEVIFVYPHSECFSDDGMTAKPLVHRQTYVIAAFELHKFYVTGLGIIVRGHAQDGWDSSFFRPVIKTDIRIFTEILERENVPSTEKEKA